MKPLFPRLAALSLCAALLLPAHAAQEEPAVPITPAQMQEDLDYLYTALQAGHPNLFSATPQT